VGFANSSGENVANLVDGSTEVTHFNVSGGDFTSSSIIDSGSVATTPNTDNSVISGSIVGILSQDSNHSGLALAGGFSLFNQSKSSDMAYGTFIWQWEDQFLTAGQREDFRTENTGYGLLATASNDGLESSGLFGGPALLLDTDGNSVDDDAFITNRVFGASSFTTPLSLTAGDSASKVFTSGSLVASEKTLSTTAVSGVTFGAWNGDNSSTVFKQAVQQADGSNVSSAFATDAFFVLADPIAAANLAFPMTGSLTWDNGEILTMQGQSQRFDSGAETFWDLNSTLTNHVFNLTLDFDTANYSGDFSLRVQEEVPITWQGTFATLDGTDQLSASTVFLEADTSSGTNTLTLTDVFDSVDGDNPLSATTKSGYLGGYFVGDTDRQGLVIGFSLTANGANLNGGDSALATDRTLAGTILFSGNANEEEVVASGSLNMPEPTIESNNINWRSWDNPIEENWVVVKAGADALTELQTSNHLAVIDATPVANLTGSGSYGSSAASSFIGSGSAGAVTQVVAGLDVDFNTGAISNGNLQIAVAGSQAWDIDFAGSVQNGMVDLNAIGGTLSDPGGLISHSIEANLGGVFTGANAEAFVGGFDLIDELNQFNRVDGLYTIER
jgi:hypothetical protein